MFYTLLNMQRITEQKLKNHSIFRLVTLDDAGHIVNETRYDCRMECFRRDGLLIIILYDKDGHVREEAGRFLNEYLRGDSEASRLQAGYALNISYTFFDMTGKDYQNLTLQDIKDFQDFCRGITVEGHLGGPVTFRCAKTCNMYYAWVKRYVSYNRWDLSAFSLTRKKQVGTIIQDIPVLVNVTSDPNRLREDPQDYTDPKMHLMPIEVLRLLEHISESGNNTALMMSELQLFTGIRIGGMLGLTLQDIETYVDDSGEERHRLILRNRVSDRRDQASKGLYHPRRVEEYKTKTYESYKTWEIPLADFLYEDLLNYIEKTRDPKIVSTEVLKRIREDAAADNVRPDTDKSDNEYVFVGRNGRRMTAWTWNNWLKKYFLDLKIPIDTGKKSTNCSHRLRHSFAMYCAHYASVKKTRYELKTLLTHNSILSSEAYYTPTPKERAQLQVDCQNEILDMLLEEKEKKNE